MNPLLHWLTSPKWTHVVGALLHSLWQGAILAVILALVLRRQTNPVARYRCALGALGLLLIASLITWAVLNTPQPTAPMASPASTLAAPAPMAANAFQPNATDKIIAIAALAQPQAKINWTAWIALSWLFGTLLMLIRASIKVAGAEKLRRSCRPLADDHIAALVAEACRAVQLTRKIRVAVTERLTSPAVVGVLVPTLILPLSLFTTLTPTQIQFVLLHELAHIRRGDYLANLFQLFAEALLFFNPAVWWISHQIRREREACCDALAIELSGAPADYARTLVRVAENILQPAPAAAPAFGDDGREPSSLTDRVQRLLVPGYRPALRLTWRAMATSLLVGITLLVLSALGTRNTVGAILASNQPTISPRVAGDDSTIPTMTIPALAEFAGYDLATAATFVPTPVTRAGQSIDSVLPLPIFRVRQITTSSKVPFLGDLPGIGKLFTSESSTSRQTWFSGDDSFGMENWTVGGQNQTSKQWFWYRTGGQTRATPTSTGILTEPQFQEVLKTVEQRDDINLLAESPIMIASNREAQIRATLINLNNPSTYSPSVTNAPPNKTPAEPLVTRSFEVDVIGFYAAVRKAAELAETVPGTNLGVGFRTFFAQAGVNLDPHLGKSFFFSDSRGQMWVRATSDEMDIIERLLRPLAGIPLSRGDFQIAPQTLADARSSLPPEINSILATNPAAGFRALPESFDPTDPRPKQVYYNAESGALQARATEADFQKFASVLKVVPLPRKQPQPKSSPAPNAPPQLATRTFAVGPMELAKALGRTGPLSVTSTAEMVSACLTQAGLDLQPPKSVFFKDPLSLLLVRATPTELDAFEKFLARANQETASAPPTAKAPDRNSPDGSFPSSTNLHTRTFAVDMDALSQAVAQRLGTNVFSPDKPDEVKWPAALRQLFASVGVALELPESLYFNYRKGELFVRAPLADLDAIETFLGVLNYQAPQVNIKVRWIEIPMDTDLLSLSRPTNAAALPVLRPQKLFGVLTETQTDEILRRLRQNKGFSLISEGQVTTLSARQAQLQVAEVKTIVIGIKPEALTPPGVVIWTNAADASGLNAEVMPLGPVLDVMPIVSSDQNQISLHIEATTKEFLGYDKKAPEVRVYINGKEKKTVLPLPRYLVRQMTNDCVLRDGHTLVLGHLPTTEIATQQDGTIQRTDVTTTRTNNLCVLVTATLIDPAGNRLNPPK